MTNRMQSPKNFSSFAGIEKSFKLKNFLERSSLKCAMLLDTSTLKPKKFATQSCKIAGRDAKIMAAPSVIFGLQIREKGHVSKVGLAARPLCTHGKELRLTLPQG